jgi:hypothetical protein
MTISITFVLPLVIALVGAIVYFVSSNPKIAELGRIIFAVCLLAFMLGKH